MSGYPTPFVKFYVLSDSIMFYHFYLLEDDSDPWSMLRSQCNSSVFTTPIVEVNILDLPHHQIEMS